MKIDMGNPNIVEIVSAMFGLVENSGFTPNEVIALIDEIKRKNYEELVEVYNNR